MPTTATLPVRMLPSEADFASVTDSAAPVSKDAPKGYVPFGRTDRGNRSPMKCNSVAHTPELTSGTVSAMNRCKLVAAVQHCVRGLKIKRLVSCAVWSARNDRVDGG
jgi:hypothetical protein